MAAGRKKEENYVYQNQLNDSSVIHSRILKPPSTSNFYFTIEFKKGYGIFYLVCIKTINTISFIIIINIVHCINGI